MTADSRSRLVNAITFSRVPLIFAWLGFAAAHEFSLVDAIADATERVPPVGNLTYAVLACLMMLLSGLTDAWDGSLARRWNVVSTLGKMADPLMDKVFYIVAFPALTWQAMHQAEGDAHAFALLLFTILYMLRDTWVTFMRAIGAMYGANVAAMFLGKIRTAMSFPGAGWVYIYLAFHRVVPASYHTAWLASCYVVEGFLALLTLWSLWTYTAAYLPYLRRAIQREEAA